MYKKPHIKVYGTQYMVRGRRGTQVRAVRVLLYGAVSGKLGGCLGCAGSVLGDTGSTVAREEGNLVRRDPMQQPKQPPIGLCPKSRQRSSVIL